jgi:hypothetical protein
MSLTKQNGKTRSSGTRRKKENKKKGTVPEQKKETHTSFLRRNQLGATD